MADDSIIMLISLRIGDNAPLAMTYVLNTLNASFNPIGPFIRAQAGADIEGRSIQTFLQGKPAPVKLSGMPRSVQHVLDHESGESEDWAELENQTVTSHSYSTGHISSRDRSQGVNHGPHRQLFTLVTR